MNRKIIIQEDNRTVTIQDDNCLEYNIFGWEWLIKGALLGLGYQPETVKEFFNESINETDQ